MSNPPVPEKMSAIKLALLAKQTRAKTAEILNAEPIAIIGMGGRFPKAVSPEALWQLLIQKGDAISEVPPDRWLGADYYDPDPSVPGKMSTIQGGFLDQVDQFDPAFFGISPREAHRMDPQQRLFLEVAYEALQDAGQVDKQLAGSQTGVFVSSYHNDYGLMQQTNPEDIDSRTLTGVIHSIVPNRLSFLLNLHGPSLSIDSACSSSLVAVHLACQSLRNQECDMALAGGVSLIIAPEVMISLSQVGFLAPNGRCKTFDASADGFGRGEGCGVVVLKRLTDALAAGDHVLALIRGSAVNQDGRSNVLTAPNGLAHQDVVRRALRNAQLLPDDITYVETHGTGTVLGDPIEVEALAEVFGGPRQDGQPCVLGALKSNIGHLEAAAGIAGLIKVVLSLQHGSIPPNVHFQTLNPYISLENTPFIIPTETIAWAGGAKDRIAGVSSFGVGGTNAHVIIAEAPRLPDPKLPDDVAKRPFLLTLSAHTPEALRQRAHALSDTVDSTDSTLYNLTYTTNVRTSHYTHRLAVVTHSPQELREKLKAFSNNTRQSDLISGQKIPGKRRKLGFVFSGQGSQWWGMGRDLLQQEPVFRAIIEQCDTLLQAYTGWSLLSELMAPEAQSRLDETEVAQPAIFALQIGLTALWRSWGIEPNVVVGHSVGEIAAAYIAGALTLEDAIRIAYHRSRLMQQATGTGTMAAVGLPAAEAEAVIAGYGSRLSVAAINSPTNTVLSGEPEALAEVLSALSEKGIFTRELRVNYAFHSNEMAPFQDALTAELQTLSPSRATLPVYSTVTGAAIQGEAFDAAYWGRNVRQTVRFAAAISSMIADEVDTWLEISPHAVLAAMIDECVQAEQADCVIAVSLRRHKPEQATLLTALGTLYAHGYAVKWDAIYPVRGQLTALPLYPWQRQRYWLDLRPREQRVHAHSGQSILLGERLDSPALTDIVFANELSADWPPFLNDHRLWKTAVFPATAYIEMALSAANSIWGKGPVRLHDLDIQAPLVLPEEGSQPIQLVLTPSETGVTFRLFSRGDGETAWKSHTQGRMQTIPDALPPTPPDLADLQLRCPDVVTAVSHYKRFQERGLTFGPQFQGVQQIWQNKAQGEGLAKVELPGSVTAVGYQFHPVLLDSCLQLLTTLIDDGQTATPYLPIGLDSLEYYQPPRGKLWSHAQLRETNSPETSVGDVLIFDEDGQTIAAVKGMRFQRASQETIARWLQPQTEKALKDWLVNVNWKPQERAALQPFQAAGNWLILADHTGLGTDLAADLKIASGAVTLIQADELETLTNFWQQTEPQLLRGIIHLGGCDLSPVDSASLAALQQTQATLMQSMLTLVKQIAQVQSAQPPKLWLVTRGAQALAPGEPVTIAARPLWGLAQSLRLEHPELHCTTIDLNAYPQVGEADELWREIQVEADENEIALHNNGRYVSRLTHYQPSPAASSPLHLTMPHRGQIDDLHLQPTARSVPESNEVEIRVLATGMNFRDVLKALDMYPGQEILFGDECAGIITAVGADVTHLHVGDAVFGIAVDSYSTYAITHADFLVHKPPQLSFTDAATIPIAFLTAYYSLHHLAHIQAGDHLLIHAAAGGVGQAAVQLAQQAGADVWATAGSPEKRSFLHHMGVKHIFDSRSLAFADQIRQQTNGTGMDIVLNSLNGEFIESSFDVLAENGRFLEMGKIGIWDAQQATQRHPHCQYHIIYLGDLYHDQTKLIQAMLQAIATGLENGALRPLPRQVFPLDNVKDAFRFMAQARHIGKIVVTQTNDKNDALLDHISADGAYLVTGGFSGIGLHVARWLAEQGARHITLVGRRGAPIAAQPVLQELADMGVTVTRLAADISQEDNVAHVVQTIIESGIPLRGIFHSAGVNADGVLQQQEWADFKRVFDPKLNGAWHLHTLTLANPPDFFVLFSSAASLIGSAGQANYAAANAFLDGFAQWRKSLGLATLSINWGAWQNVGMTAVLSAQDLQRWQRQGMDVISPENGLTLLGQMPANGPAQIGVLPIYAKTFAPTNPFFAELLPAPQLVLETAVSTPSSQSLAEKLADTPASKRPGLLLTHIREVVRHVLGFDAAQAIPDQQPLGDMGMDSLMAVELRNALSDAVAVPLPATLMFDYPTVTALADYLKQYIPAMTVEETAVSPTPIASTTTDLDDLSDEEAEALLLAELDSLHD